jgi:hypothetical protein
MAIETPSRPSSALFDVYLRLRPSNSANARFLNVEETEAANPTHITIKPPTNDNRKRAVERFAFTRVFEEDSKQLELFKGVGVVPLIEGVLGGNGHGRDGLLATLGVTGSGKVKKSNNYSNRKAKINCIVDSHDTGNQVSARFDPDDSRCIIPECGGSTRAVLLRCTSLLISSSSGRVGGAHVHCHGVPGFFVWRQPVRALPFSSANSYAGKPIFCSTPPCTSNISSSSPIHSSRPAPPFSPETLLSVLKSTFSPRKSAEIHSIRPVTGYISSISRSSANIGSPVTKDCSSFLTFPTNRSNKIPRPSTLPQSPSVHDIEIFSDPDVEYAIVISMYEVYNDRIFDLLSGNVMRNKQPNTKRRALLFKSTELSPDKKVVAGLTKIICGSLEEALMVLETGLMERKVAGTGSNAVSSRSHGFFCVEVKKRHAHSNSPWSSSTLTIVDLAGSERARQAKTAGATLAEAGKINESLMYLGQCMQMQADYQEGSKVRIHHFMHIP